MLVSAVAGRNSRNCSEIVNAPAQAHRRWVLPAPVFSSDGPRGSNPARRRRPDVGCVGPVRHRGRPGRAGNGPGLAPAGPHRRPTGRSIDAVARRTDPDRLRRVVAPGSRCLSRPELGAPAPAHGAWRRDGPIVGVRPIQDRTWAPPAGDRVGRRTGGAATPGVGGRRADRATPAAAGSPSAPSLPHTHRSTVSGSTARAGGAPVNCASASACSSSTANLRNGRAENDSRLIATARFRSVGRRC